MPGSYGQGKKVQAIQSILCCAYITIILVISTDGADVICEIDLEG
jgi:hypothetical protein